MSFIQNLLDEANKNAAVNRLKNTSQISLGELISQIQQAGTQNGSGNEKTVEFDFCGLAPQGQHSWRGSYIEFAIGYSEDTVTADSFLEELKSSVGHTFQGYKGGDFTMDENSPVWVAKYNRAGATAVTGVLDLGDTLIIQTAYIDY